MLARCSTKAHVLYCGQCIQGRPINTALLCDVYSALILYTVSRKVSTFILSVTLSNLNRFSFFYTTESVCYLLQNSLRHYPHHLRHVATLPWEIKISNFLSYGFCRIYHTLSSNAKILYVVKSSLSNRHQTHDVAYFTSTECFHEFTFTCYSSQFCLWTIKNVSTNVNDVLGSGEIAPVPT